MPIHLVRSYFAVDDDNALICISNYQIKCGNCHAFEHLNKQFSLVGKFKFFCHFILTYVVKAGTYDSLDFRCLSLSKASLLLVVRRTSTLEICIAGMSKDHRHIL